MAEGLNRVVLFGNLGTDPELRVAPTGTSLLTFRLATTEVYLDKNQARQERTEWHTVTMFGKRAEPLSRLLSKGSRVLVEGRIHTSSYEKDGQKKSKTEIVASDIVLAGSASRGTTNGAAIPNGVGFGAADLQPPF